MSLNNIKATMQSERGFTIVELLIVIVVIGILAAITIVSFNGVTARANTASAQSASESMIKKIEAYNAENSKYPTSALTTILASANSNTSYFLSGVTLSGTTPMTVAPSSASVVSFYACGTGATTTAPVSPVSNITVPTGAQVAYWNYQTSAPVIVSTGVTSGLIGTNNVGCIVNAS